MSWTNERETTLKKMWQDGLSASQIATQLGGVTRNGIIGKVHRLGLAGRAVPSPPTRAVVKQPEPAPVLESAPRRKQSRARPNIPANPLLVCTEEPSVPPRIEGPGLATVLTIEKYMCRWPIGDPSSDDFTFCGEPTKETFCKLHKQDAYSPPTARRKTGKAYEQSLRYYYR